MGYRNYLYKINKQNYVEGKLRYDYDDNIVTELYEIGKYVDSKLVEKLIVIFPSPDDEEFQVIDIESIPEIITYYSNRHLNFLNSLKDGTSEQFTLESYIDSQIRRWSSPKDFIYNVDKNMVSIVNSWEFQYEIFDLLRIYKTFNVEHDYLLWVGH